MKAEEAIKLLHALREELGGLEPTVESAEFNSWSRRTTSVLTKSLGEAHHITDAFTDIAWSSPYIDTPSAASIANFRRAALKTEGLLDAATFELEQLRDATDIVEDAAYDSELWEHVNGHVVAGEWGKLASQTSIFTEDRIRIWAGRSPDEVGEKLMTAVFGAGSDSASASRAGRRRVGTGLRWASQWHSGTSTPTASRSGMIFRPYAMGVLGASSLLLTQMRYEHSNRFHDTSPSPTDTPADA